MKICRSIQSLHAELPAQAGKTTGLVPTMGFLHQGHLSLVRRCREENDLTVVSIFVNPTQFGPAEDLQQYPRDPEKDIALLEKENTDILFMPENDEMYPQPYRTYINVAGLDKMLCGQTRPGHFRGVATVVLKLINLACPARAYFGQKDAQQAIVIRQMVHDLNLPVQIRVLAIVRDSDGLALSSRNVYLSPAERQAALLLPKSLQKAAVLISSGVEESQVIRESMQKELARDPLLATEYISIVNLQDLQEIPVIEAGNTMIAAAVRAGRTRLIDNLLLGDLSC
ncbi:MAG: pantoate--beta-alanine ligase [Chrysiogenales bacterium]|nr:MAG: pantoate--beta-alanine ligase [Chrysiogenales bacterium]